MRFNKLALPTTLIVLLMAGCSTVPPVIEPPPVESSPLPPADVVDAEPLPPTLGPLPPTLEVLEAFDQAVAAMQAGEFEAARRQLEEVLASNVELVGAHVNLGIARLRLNDEPGATQAFEHALELQPDHPVALNQLAILERRAGRFDQAQDFYRRALDGQPDYPPLHLNMGILCDLYLRQTECALSHYARYVALGGEQAEQVGLWIVDLERRTGEAQ